MRRTLLAASLLLAGAGPVPLDYLGVNLSGAEFGGTDGAHRIAAGQPGHDYTFPTAAEISGYAGRGFNLIRLPFAWERLQPAANGPLDEGYLAGLDGVVRDAGARGMVTIVEPANQGWAFDALVGSPALPDSTFADLWRRLAIHYRGHPLVWFGLMNEPHDQAPEDWARTAAAAVAAIRTAGARNEVLVPGTHYAQGASWVSRGNAAALEHFTDPAGNMAFEIHQYNDADHSGRSATPVSATIGAERLQAVTAWAEAGGRRLFLAEFGAGEDAVSIAAMRKQIGFVQAHRDVWQGAAIWGGGPWWPAGYPLAVEYPDGHRSPQLDALASFMPALRHHPSAGHP